MLKVVLIIALAFSVLFITNTSQAISLFRAADANNPASPDEAEWNEGFVCSEVTGFCYSFGGEAEAGCSASFPCDDDILRYDLTTDQWSTMSATIPGNGDKFQGEAKGDFQGTLVLIGNNGIYQYDEAEDTIVSGLPVIAGTGSSVTGASLGDTLYAFAGGAGNSAAINMITLDETVIADVPFSTQWAKSVNDPTRNEIVIFGRDNGLMAVYDPVTDSYDETPDPFPPCDGAGAVCIPDMVYFDVEEEAVVGARVDPSFPDRMTLWRLNRESGTWTDIGQIIDINFNDDQFTSNISTVSDWYQSPFAVNSVAMFGSGKSAASNPTGDANRWWNLIGDVAPFVPEPSGVDQWFENLVTTFGLDNEFGRLLLVLALSAFVVIVGVFSGTHWTVLAGLLVILNGAFAVFGFVPAGLFLTGMVVLVMMFIISVIIRREMS